MISFFAAVSFLGGVIALMKFFELLPRASRAVRTSQQALDVIKDPQLADDRKESLLQGYSLSALGAFLDLLSRAAGSIAIPIAILWALDLADVVSLEAVLTLSATWPFLLGGVFAALAALWRMEK